MLNHVAPVGRSARADNRSAGQESLREHNLAVVFHEIMVAPKSEPPSRAELAGRTGLAKATVSALVARLIELRLVAEDAPQRARHVGRPAVPLRPAAQTWVGLGLEVNVDYMGLRALDLTRAVVEEWIEPADLRGAPPAAVLGRLFARAAQSVGALRDRGMEVVGTGLALPGLVGYPRGPLRFAPNLGWREADILALAGQAVAGLHVAPDDRAALRRVLVDGLTLDNEATLAGWAETLSRPAGRADSFVYLSGAVGVGAALVVSGALVRGLHGWAGEIGHTVVDPAGPKCACGSRGCLEQYAGKQAILRAAGLDERGAWDGLIDRLGQPGAAGERARAAVASAAWALGLALAAVINVFDIAECVVGGELLELTGWLAPGIMAELDSRVLAARWIGEELAIRPGTAGEHAALTGGAWQALSRVVENPAVLLGP
jgi:predicted NBD/HSP70 family sugar kinase